MSGYDEALLKRARALHDAPNVTMDGHNDLPWALHDAYDHRLAKFDLREPVWKSTSELRYPEKYCVDLLEPPRNRADAATGTTSHRWREITTPSRRRSYGSTSRR